MSYRDLRNFTEMMRALGYNRLISMENFRTPNFPLVAEVLLWLTRRFEPNADIHTDFTTEQDRVMLVRSVAQFMAINANIKLNTKWLYQADGYAVKELLKISSLLYDALKINRSVPEQQDIMTSSALDISSRLADLKLTRELASRITAKGASLYQLLGKEAQLREERLASVSAQLELSAVEEGLKEAVEGAKSSVTTTKTAIENISATESSLDNKIEKRQQDLERNNKRLQTLRKVRPAFLEEFERLEVDLRRLYQDYIARFRCVAYLEQQLEDAELAEHERIEMRQAETRKMLEKMRQEEALKLLDDAFEPSSLYDPQTPSSLQTRLEPSAKPSSVAKVSRVRTSTGTTGARRVYGGMNVDEDDSLDDDDSDLLLDDDDNSQLLASEDDLELLDPSVIKASEQSDDDF